MNRLTIYDRSGRSITIQPKNERISPAIFRKIEKAFDAIGGFLPELATKDGKIVGFEPRIYLKIGGNNKLVYKVNIGA